MTPVKMKYVLTVVCALIGVSINTPVTTTEGPRNATENSNKEPEQDIYWRIWRGKMPKDAVIGGYTKSHSGLVDPVYLAQAYFTDKKLGIQAGSMFKYSKSLKIVYRKTQHEATEDIQILCVDDPSILAWLPYNKAKILDPEADCVIAGYQESVWGLTRLHFGRTTDGDQTVIGKVMMVFSKMYYPHAGEEVETNEFEVLCYKKSLLKIPRLEEEIAERARQYERDRQERIRKRKEEKKFECFFC